MKRIYLSLLMLVTFITSLAQFKITPEGFRTEAEHTSYVANMNGTTEEIFRTIEDVVCKNMGLTISSQQFVEKQTEEGICIAMGVHSDVIKLASYEDASLNSIIGFTIVIKNNKMMFCEPFVNETVKTMIYDVLIKSNEPASKKCIEDIENKINKMINEIIHKTDISCW